MPELHGVLGCSGFLAASFAALDFRVQVRLGLHPAITAYQEYIRFAACLLCMLVVTSVG